MKVISLLAALALSLSACKKKEQEGAPSDPPKPTEGTAAPTAPTEPPKASGRAIPNSDGLVVDAPEKWKNNGIGGAAGMHLDADAGMFMVRETAPEEAAKNLDTWKKETEEIAFQKWTSAEALPDGFKALYVMDKMEMKGDDMVKAGSLHAFHVRRKIGDKVHDCYGSATAEADAKEGLELCLKVATK